MKPGIGEEERLTKDEIARRKLGPRRVPASQDFAKMTPQEEKNIPNTGVFDGHTAWSVSVRPGHRAPGGLRARIKDSRRPVGA